MPDPCKENAKNPIAAYRHLYVVSKADFCKWTNRSVPGWFAYGRSLVDSNATKEELFKSEKLRSLDEFKESDSSSNSTVDDDYEPPAVKVVNYYEDGLKSKETTPKGKGKGKAKAKTEKPKKSAKIPPVRKAKRSLTQSDNDDDDDFVDVKRRKQQRAK